jgi:hypothetical protein
MKELLIFRIFVLFPFIGITLPDIANRLTAVSARISAGHIIIDITLAVCIIICSAGIWFYELNKELPLQNPSSEAEELQNV